MKKGFTLLEVMVVLVIVGILAALAYVTYSNVLGNAKAEVCKSNLKVLLMAVEIYALENSKTPMALSQLERKHLEKAFAQFLSEEDGFRLKLAYFMLNLNKKSNAYAALPPPPPPPPWVNNYVEDLKFLMCPSDNVIPSYAINCNSVCNINYAAYKLLSDNTVVIVDADSASITGTNVALRHTKYKLPQNEYYCIGITKGKVIRELTSGNDIL
ncbi:MAG: prepilin-type N-terminal cleavage/methylation domain-containing protein [Candidatus Omnitrophota bacterium]